MLKNTLIILMAAFILFIILFNPSTWFSTTTPSTASQNTHVKPSISLSWQCQNDIEINCLNKQCDITEKGAFTPMQITLNLSEPDNSNMSVCAYSGCWEGKAKWQSDESFIVVTGQALAFSTDLQNDPQKQSIAITIDPSDGIGLIKAGSFAQPILCSTSTTPIPP